MEKTAGYTQIAKSNIIKNDNRQTYLFYSPPFGIYGCCIFKSHPKLLYSSAKITRQPPSVIHVPRLRVTRTHPLLAAAMSSRQVTLDSAYSLKPYS